MKRKTYTPDELDAMTLDDMTKLRNGAIYRGDSRLACLLTRTIQSRIPGRYNSPDHSDIVSKGGMGVGGGLESDGFGPITSSEW